MVYLGVEEGLEGLEGDLGDWLDWFVLGLLQVYCIWD